MPKIRRNQLLQAAKFESIVNPIKLETGLRPNSAGIPYTLLLRIEAIGFPTFWLMPVQGLEGSRAGGCRRCPQMLHSLLESIEEPSEMECGLVQYSINKEFYGILRRLDIQASLDQKVHLKYH